MSDWRCGHCGAINLEGQRGCEACGREPEVEETPSRPMVSHAEACDWRTQGRSCGLLATLWTEPVGNYKFNKFGQVTAILRPGYCAWHFECLSSPRLADDFDEFDRLQALWRKRPYCNQFVHHPAEYVWQTLRGVLRDPVDRMRVRPCEVSTCWVPDVVETAIRAQRPLSAREGRAQIGRIVQTLLTPVGDAEPLGAITRRVLPGLP